MEAEMQVLWDELLAAMGDGHVASHLYLAKQFTSHCPDDGFGWVAFADILGKVARYKDARAALSRAKALLPDGVEDFLYAQLGNLYTLKDDMRRAESWYRRALAMKPAQKHWTSLGICLGRQGRLDEALRCHRRALRFKGKRADVYYNIGLILRGKRKKGRKKGSGYFSPFLRLFLISRRMESAYSSVLHNGYNAEARGGGQGIFDC